MEIKFSEEEVREIIRKHTTNKFFTFELENKEITVKDHYGDFVVSITDSPAQF